MKMPQGSNHQPFPRQTAGYGFKNIIGIFIIISALFLCTLNSWANEQSIMAKLVYNLPDSIAKITKPDDLKRFLYSDFIIDRCRGIYKLGLIGDSSNINQLMDIYNSEPVISGHIVDKCEGVKYFAIKAIADIGGSKAESTLLTLGNQLIGSAMSDSLMIIKGMSEALVILGTQASGNLLDKYYMNTDFYISARIYALNNYILFSLNNSQIKTNADSINFVLSYLPLSDSIGSKNTENYIKFEAVMYTLLDTIFCNTQSISHLRTRLNEIADRPKLHEQLQFVSDQMESYYNYNMLKK
jgi:hypothetical protein